jgi:hypothetical protein
MDTVDSQIFDGAPLQRLLDLPLFDSLGAGRQTFPTSRKSGLGHTRRTRVLGVNFAM